MVMKISRLEIESNQETIKSTVQKTLVGAGIGGLAGHAMSVIVPAARMAAPAGAVFGVLFSLLRMTHIIHVVVGAFFGKMFDLVGFDIENNKSGIAKFAASLTAMGSMYLIHGALAFGATTLLLPGFTLSGALTLTAVIGTIDFISLVVLEKAWMFE